MLKRTVKQRMKLDAITVGERFRKDLGDISGLADNIKEYGLLVPLVVSSDGNLVAGGRRYAACTAAGLPDVSVVVVDSPTELEARELELIENVFRKDMLWPERAMLEKKIFTLKQEQDPKWSQRDNAEFLGQSLGITNRRLQLADFIEAMPALAAMENEADAVKSIKGMQENILVNALAEEAKKNPAYKWAADHYKVGDAISGMSAMHPGVVEFAEVDPPYGVDLLQHKSKLQLGENDPSVSPYQEVDRKEYPTFIRAAAEQVYRILRDNSYAVWWHGSVWGYEVRAILEGVGFKVHGVPAIWVKESYNGQSNMPNRMLSAAYEPFWICEKGTPQLHKPGRNNVFSFKPQNSGDKVHPAERPIELIEEIINTFSAPGQVIVSPFLGSGTTLRAAYRLHRTAFGWDMSEEYKQAFMSVVQKENLSREEDEKAA